jgi:pimeloyl-ACP methyl ester carboxylesterase
MKQSFGDTTGTACRTVDVWYILVYKPIHFIRCILCRRAITTEVDFTMWIPSLATFSVCLVFPHGGSAYVGNTKRSGSSPPRSNSEERKLGARRQSLEPPFPNGICGGKILTIPPEETFGIDVNLANINLGGNLVLPPRPLRVWLPPDYQEGDRHPTLYVHDGQNAMDDSESWTGTSWRLTGALTRMAERGVLRDDRIPILVLLPSMDGDFLPGIRRRHLEYGDSNFPFSQAHADFVAKTVKPLVDARFRTKPEAEHTFAIGSSLGGQASLHLMLRHHDRFGGAAALSPAFGPNLIQEISSSSAVLEGKRIYLDMGGDINDVKVPWVDVLDHLTSEHWWNPGYFWLDTQLQGGMESMKQALNRAGAAYQYKEFPGGRHNERAWAQRVHVSRQKQY